MSSAARFVLGFQATGDQDVVNKIREVGQAGSEASAALQELGDAGSDIQSSLSAKQSHTQ